MHEKRRERERARAHARHRCRDRDRERKRERERDTETETETETETDRGRQRRRRRDELKHKRLHSAGQFGAWVSGFLRGRVQCGNSNAATGFISSCLASTGWRVHMTCVKSGKAASSYQRRWVRCIRPSSCVCHWVIAQAASAGRERQHHSPDPTRVQPCMVSCKPRAQWS